MGREWESTEEHILLGLFSLKKKHQKQPLLAPLLAKSTVQALSRSYYTPLQASPIYVLSLVLNIHLMIRSEHTELLALPFILWWLYIDIFTLPCIPFLNCWNCIHLYCWEIPPQPTPGRSALPVFAITPLCTCLKYSFIALSVIVHPWQSLSPTLLVCSSQTHVCLLLDYESLGGNNPALVFFIQHRPLQHRALAHARPEMQHKASCPTQSWKEQDRGVAERN